MSVSHSLVRLRALLHSCIPYDSVKYGLDVSIEGRLLLVVPSDPSFSTRKPKCEVKAGSH